MFGMIVFIIVCAAIILVLCACLTFYMSVKSKARDVSKKGYSSKVKPPVQ